VYNLALILAHHMRSRWLSNVPIFSRWVLENAPFSGKWQKEKDPGFRIDKRFPRSLFLLAAE
jgi:hypothetical protein